MFHQKLSDLTRRKERIRGIVRRNYIERTLRSGNEQEIPVQPHGFGSLLFQLLSILFESLNASFNSIKTSPKTPKHTHILQNALRRKKIKMIRANYYHLESRRKRSLIEKLQELRSTMESVSPSPCLCLCDAVCE
jgi:hypothetical protein